MGFLSFVLALIAIGLLVALIRKRGEAKELEAKNKVLRSDLVDARNSAETFRNKVTTLTNDLSAERKRNTASNLVDTARTIARDTASKLSYAAPAPKPAAKKATPAPVRKATTTSRPSSSRSYGSRSSSYNDGTDLITGLALGAAIASSYDNDSYSSSSSSSSDYGSSSSSYSDSSSSSSSYDSGSSGGGWE